MSIKIEEINDKPFERVELQQPAQINEPEPQINSIEDLLPRVDTNLYDLPQQERYCPPQIKNNKLFGSQYIQTIQPTELPKTNYTNYLIGGGILLTILSVL
jgi:hypothetical protein